MSNKILIAKTPIQKSERHFEYVEIKENSIPEEKVPDMVQFVLENAEARKLRQFLTTAEASSGRLSRRTKKEKTIAKVYSMFSVRPSLHIPADKVYKIQQELLQSAFLTTSATLVVGSAASFTLASLDNAASFALVFDQYRIAKIESWLYDASGGANVITGGSLFSVIDYDDATALTTVASICDYQNVLSSPTGQSHYHVFVPHVAVAAYSGVFTSFANEAAPWIDVASSGVIHFGIKAITTAGIVVAYSLQSRLFLEFRNVR